MTKWVAEVYGVLLHMRPSENPTFETEGSYRQLWAYPLFRNFADFSFRTFKGQTSISETSLQLPCLKGFLSQFLQFHTATIAGFGIFGFSFSNSNLIQRLMFTARAAK